MTRRGKIFLIGVAATAFLGLCLFCSVRISRQGILTIYPPKLLEVDFLDAGQGDAELIKTPYGQNILIDGGPDNKVLSELGRNLPLFEKKIDLIILTHPHDDHVIGLIDVLKKYQVGKILLADSPGNAPAYEEFLRLLSEKNFCPAAVSPQSPLRDCGGAGSRVILVLGRQTITLGPDLRLEILHPEKGDIGLDLNEDSIVARLIYKNKTFLFTGDASLKTEAKLLGEKIDLRTDVLKVGHHGSETASTLDFLRVVTPEYAVIECGVNNQFGFPKADTLWRLQKVGAKILRTDLNGTIKIKSDGESIKVRSKK
jgi:competence protein ComEC